MNMVSEIGLIILFTLFLASGIRTLEKQFSVRNNRQNSSNPDIGVPVYSDRLNKKIVLRIR